MTMVGPTLVKQVAPVADLAPLRFRTLLLNSQRIHAAHAHYTFVYSLFRGAGSVIQRISATKPQLMEVVQKGGELSLWITNLLSETDPTIQQTLFQQIADRLAVFSYYLEDLCMVVGYDTLSQQGSGALVEAATAPNSWAMAYTAGSSHACSTLPSLGACLKPLLDLLTSSELTSASTADAPTPLGQTLRLLAATSCSWQIEAADSTTPNGVLALALRDLTDTGSVLNQAIFNDLGFANGLIPASSVFGGPGTFSFDMTGQQQTGVKLGFWPSKELSGLVDLASNYKLTIVGMIGNIENDINDAMAAANEVGQIITDIEQIFDTLAATIDSVVALIAIIVALL